MGAALQPSQNAAHLPSPNSRLADAMMRQDDCRKRPAITAATTRSGHALPVAATSNGGNHDRRVAERVVAAEQPHRLNVGVTLAMLEQDDGADDVDDKRDDAEGAHQLGLRHMGNEHPVERGGEHADPHDGEEDALEQRRARPPERRPSRWR